MLDLACLYPHTVVAFNPRSTKLFLFLNPHLGEEWNQWRDQILAQLQSFNDLKIPLYV